MKRSILLLSASALFAAATKTYDVRWQGSLRDPRWKSLATYALATGIAVLLLLLAGRGLVRPSGAPLHPWWGLFQWILLAVWLPCTVVLALRMLRVARAGDSGGHAHG